MPVFEARGVWKRYGATVALSEVTVDYDAGLNLIMGPNGSGKSTLLRILVGLTKPSKGIVRSFGVDPWRHRTGILKRTGLAVEGQYLPPLAPGREYLRLFAKNRGLGWSELERIAGELGVTGYWDKPIASYSMGMRKRILLAQAFLGARDALVLDEPYTLLDPRTVGVVSKLIEEHARDIPVLMATHIMPDPGLEPSTLTILAGGRVLVHESRLRLGEAGIYKCTFRHKGELIEFLASNNVEKARIEGTTVIARISGEPGKRGECKSFLDPLIAYEEALSAGGTREPPYGSRR